MILLMCKGCREAGATAYALEKVVLNGKAISGEPSLYCSLCGDPVGAGLTMADIGALPLREGPLAPGVRWSDAPIPRWLELRDFHPISREQVFCSRVPAFRDGATGALVVPHLPVHPASLALVDLERFRANFEEWRGKVDPRTNEYTARVPLRAYPGGEPVTWTCKLAKGNGEVAYDPASDAIGGVELTLWPKLRLPQWKTFLIEATPPKGLDLSVMYLPGRPAAQAAHTGEELPGGWIALKRAGFEGFQRKGADPGAKKDPVSRLAGLCKGGRPAAIAVVVAPLREYTAQSADVANQPCGGVFLIEPASGQIPVSGPSLSLGIDFGTSNTCVAVRMSDSDSGPLVPRSRDLHEYLIHSRPEGADIPGSEAMPRIARRYHEKMPGIFPSELLFREKAVEVTGRSADQIRALRPGIDVSIPGDDVRWDGLVEENFLVDGFKWAGDEKIRTTEWNEANRDTVVVTYLKCLLPQVIAQALNDLGRGAMPKSLDVHYAFPGNWKQAARNSLGDAIQKAMAGGDSSSPVAWSVADWVDLDYDGRIQSATEALAAVRIAQKRGIGHGLGDDVPYRLNLLVDIGGGTADIALVWEPVGASSSAPRVVEGMLSLRYAGQDLIQILRGNAKSGSINCFRSGMEMSEIKRSLRAKGATNEIFHEAQPRPREARLRVFYFQLMEFLARWSAATVLNGQFDRFNPHTPGFQIGLYCLGNGWNMVDLVGWTRHVAVPGRLTERIAELLAAARDRPEFAAREFPQPHVSYFDLGGPDVHPKHAVALGLLTQAESRALAYASLQAARTGPNAGLVPATAMLDGPWKDRAVVGLPFAKKEIGVKDAAEVVVPWWLPLEDGRHMPEVHGADTRFSGSGVSFRWSLAFFEEQKAALPPLMIGAAADSLDAALANAQGGLKGLVDPGERWLTESPFGWLLKNELKQWVATLNG